MCTKVKSRSAPKPELFVGVWKSKVERESSLKVVWFERVITTRANLGPRPEFAKQFNYETDERIWSG